MQQSKKFAAVLLAALATNQPSAGRGPASMHGIYQSA